MSDASASSSDRKERTGVYTVVNEEGAYEVESWDAVQALDPRPAPVLLVVTPDRLDWWFAQVEPSDGVLHTNVSFRIERGVLTVQTRDERVLAAYSPAGWLDMTTVFTGVSAPRSKS